MSAFYYVTNTMFNTMTELDFLNDPFIYTMEFQGNSRFYNNPLDIHQSRTMMPFHLVDDPSLNTEQHFYQEKLSNDNHVELEPRSPESTCSQLYSGTRRPKSFSCNYCDRSFARKYDVVRHHRIHTGVKPYICPCCNKGFSRSDARIRHFRTELICRSGADKLTQHRSNQRVTRLANKSKRKTRGQ